MASSREKTWSLQEKKSLLQAIQIYGKEDYEKLAACVGTKSPAEVKYFANKMKQGLYYQKASAVGKKAKAVQDPLGSDTPIEVWLETAENLTQQNQDFSYVLGQVMSVVEKLEPRQARNDREPNYSNLYSYIGALLRNQEPPQLSTSEATIMLDVLQNLFEELKEMDLTIQTRLMREKYRLMNSKVDPNDRRSSYMNIREALTNVKAGPSSQSASTSQAPSANGSPGPSTDNQSASGTQPDAASSEHTVAGTGQNNSSDADISQSQPSLETDGINQGEAVSNTQAGVVETGIVQGEGHSGQSQPSSSLGMTDISQARSNLQSDVTGQAETVSNRQTGDGENGSVHANQSQPSSSLETTNQGLTNADSGSSTQLGSCTPADSSQSQDSTHVPMVTVAGGDAYTANQGEVTDSNSQSEDSLHVSRDTVASSDANTANQGEVTDSNSQSQDSQHVPMVSVANGDANTANQGEVTNSNSQSQDSQLVPMVTVASGDADPTNQDEVIDSNSQSEPKKPGRKRKHEDVPTVEEIKPQKNELFSLNPFCIPVKYLNPQKRAK